MYIHYIIVTSLCCPELPYRALPMADSIRSRRLSQQQRSESMDKGTRQVRDWTEVGRGGGGLSLVPQLWILAKLRFRSGEAGDEAGGGGLSVSWLHLSSCLQLKKLFRAIQDGDIAYVSIQCNALHNHNFLSIPLVQLVVQILILGRAWAHRLEQCCF